MNKIMVSLKPISEYPEIMNARDIASYMGIGYNKALTLMKYGNLPSIKLGSTFRIYKKSFEKWLNENTIPAAPANS